MAALDTLDPVLRGFAASVEGPLEELRLELVRGVAYWSAQWAMHRDDVSWGRFVQAQQDLEALSAALRAAGV